jgi:predicted phosphoribosyltransferase
MLDRSPMTSEAFSDRAAAGRELGERLADRSGRADLVVLGLPRGGVPVAHEVARALAAPLDVLVVRKLGVPGHEELAFGAVASGGVLVLNERVLRATGIGEEEVRTIAERERVELGRRERAYRGDRAPLDVAGLTAVVVDDGLATGATMRAAIRVLRERGAGAIVVAIPVASSRICSELRRDVEEVVCLRTPEPFLAVGACYSDFCPTSDEDVRRLLGESAR